MAEKFLPSAHVVDGILVLSLPDAVHPVVWQMELGQSKSSALEVREQEDGTCLLALKTPRQDVLDIALYSSKDSATKALLCVSAAMEKARGQIYPAGQLTAIGNDSTYRPYYQPVVEDLPARAPLSGAGFGSGPVISTPLPALGKRLAIGAGVLCVLILLISALGRDRAPQSADAASATQTTVAPSGTTATGEPLSADKFLEAQ